MLKFLTFLTLITIPLYSQNASPWKQVTRPPLELSLRYLTVDSQNHLYAVDNQWGLLRSTDTARTWNKLNAVRNNIKSVSVNSKGYIIYNIDGEKVIRSSTDDGKTWVSHPVEIRPPEFKVNSFVITSDDIIFAGTSQGLYRSIDDGNNWIKESVYQNTHITQLNVKNDVIYAFQRDTETSPINILVSEDKGSTWKRTTFAERESKIIDAYFKFGNNGNVFVRGMSQGDPWYLPQAWLIISTDMGNTWSEVKTAYSMHEIVPDKSGGLLGFGEQLRGDGPSVEKGLFRSTDNGITWQDYSSYFPSKSISSMISINGEVYAVQNGFPFHSSDNGRNWVQLSTGFTGQYINDVTSYSNYIFAAGRTDCFVSKDYGINWQPVSAGTVNNGGYIKLFNVSGDMFVRQYIYHWKQGYEDYLNKFRYNSSSWINIPDMKDVISIAKNSAGTFFALTNSSSGNEGLYSSSNNGFTFQKLTGYNFSYTEPYSMIINSQDEIYITTKLFRLIRSTDNGKSFTEVHAGNRYKTKMLANSKDVLFLWSPLVRSSDYGATWDSLNNKLINVAELFIDDNDGLYALVEPFPYHLYCSYDNGDSWKDITYNLNGRSISSVTLNDQGILFAATNDELGLFKADLNTLLTEAKKDIAELPSEYFLEQNYPNPFNPSTTISFSIPEAGNVSLKVYDILGKELQVLLNEEKSPGKYELKFDASHLPSGTYIYRINTGEYMSAKKLLLLK